MRGRQAIAVESSSVTIAAPARTSYLPIHYGDVGNPPRVLCGSEEASRPVSRDWLVVTCIACLALGAERGSPTARRMLDQRRHEAEADDA